MTSTDLGLWRADDQGLVRLASTGMRLESLLEDYIEADPMLLGEQLLVIGRQVPTDFGKFIDLLAVDVDGVVHVIELKRDQTERVVVAQTLDYGSWVSTLGRDDLVSIFGRYRPDQAFEEAFAYTFGDTPEPEDWNDSQILTIVASSTDRATERIVSYLNESFDVPINVVFFRHFEDRGASYLARTLLVAGDPVATATRKASPKRTREPWNGQDWYVSFGQEPDGRQWADAQRYGFVSAGGGKWYSQTLRNLPLEARAFVYVPKVGYVGVGVVSGAAARFDQAELLVDGVQHKVAELSLVGRYQHQTAGDDDETAEYVVPVTWQHTVSLDEALHGGGLFASQHSACKLRHQFTIAKLTEAFELEDSSTTR